MRRRVFWSPDSRRRFYVYLRCSSGASGKLVTIKISHCYNVLRRGCNSYKQYVVSILLQHVFIVTILLQHISLVTMQIGCNNVKIKYLLLQQLRNVEKTKLVATMKGICYNWQIFGTIREHYSSVPATNSFQWWCAWSQLRIN